MNTTWISKHVTEDVIIALALVLRVACIIVTEIQESVSDVPLTDIDYQVFTDAAESVALGGSPYDGRTELLRADATRYRYSPLLAYMLLPNVWLHRTWGKFLFSALDLACALLLRRWLEAYAACDDRFTVRAGLGLLLFNPFCFLISTRGSCESFNILVLYGCFVLLHLHRRLLSAAVLFGLAVHFRVYPVVYALPIVLSLADPSSCGLRRLVHGRAILFGVASASAFATLALLFVRLYGWEGFDAAYLHHGRRLDPQHNFSIYFYPAALHLEDQTGRFPNLSRFAAVPQLTLCAWFGWRESRRGPLVAPLLQTIALVATNKVITAQYFMWWWALVPMALPWLAWRRWPLLRAVIFWVAAEVHWGFWAYLLEMRRWPVRPAVWGGSCLFFAAHLVLLQEMLESARLGGEAADAARGRQAAKAE